MDEDSYFEVPKELLAKYIKKSIFNLVYEHLDFEFNSAFLKKYGKKSIIEYIKNKIDIKTNPLTYKGILGQEVKDCLMYDLDIFEDAKFIDGYIYWMSSANTRSNKNLKKAEILDECYINCSEAYYTFEQPRINENLDKATKKYEQILKRIIQGV